MWLVGLAFGALTIMVDLLMSVYAPLPAGGQPPELTGPLLFTFCMSYIISGIFYALSGYVAAGLTRSRPQGQASALVAAALDGTVGGLLITLVLGAKASALDLGLEMLFGLLLNLPLGFVFGSMGAGWGSRQAR